MAEHHFRLSPRSVGAAYTEALPMLVASVGAGVLYLVQPDLWPGPWAWVALAPLVFITLAEPPWRWCFTRVALTPAHLRVSTGLWRRSDRMLRWDEIGSADTEQTWASRLWRVSAFTVAQAGDERTRIQLAGIDDATLGALLGHIDRDESARATPGAGTSAGAPAPSATLIYRARLTDLLLASLAYGQFAVLGAGAALWAWETLDATGAWPAIGSSIAADPLVTAPGVVIGVVLAGFLVTAFRYARFEAWREQNGILHLQYGLVSTHHRQIDPDAIVGLVLQRNLLESALGRIRLTLLTTDSTAELGGNTVLPSLSRAVVARVMRSSFSPYTVPGLLTDRARSGALVRLCILALTLLSSVAAAAVCRAAGGSPVLAVSIGILSLPVFWLVGRLLCARLEFDNARRVVSLTTHHVVERQRILHADAVHVVSTVSSNRGPRFVRVAYVAAIPRSLRSVRFSAESLHQLQSEVASTGASR